MGGNRSPGIVSIQILTQPTRKGRKSLEDGVQTWCGKHLQHLAERIGFAELRLLFDPTRPGTSTSPLCTLHCAARRADLARIWGFYVEQQ